MSAIATQQKSKGDTFCQQAEAELSKKSWFSSSKEKKFEDASELYQNAGNAYKVGGFYYEAGDAYSKAAILLRDKLQNVFDASKAFQNAGKNVFGVVVSCCCCQCLVVVVVSVVVVATVLLLDYTSITFTFCTFTVEI
jgi:Soluble NSF attachment protein, SNAP